MPVWGPSPTAGVSEAGAEHEGLGQGQRHPQAPGQGWRRGQCGVCEPGVCLAVRPTDSGLGPMEPAPTSNSSAGDRCPSLPRHAAEGRALAAGPQANKPPGFKGPGQADFQAGTRDLDPRHSHDHAVCSQRVLKARVGDAPAVLPGEAFWRAWPPHRSPREHSLLREAQKGQAGFCVPRAGWRQGPQGGLWDRRTETGPTALPPQRLDPATPASAWRIEHGSRGAGPLPAGGAKKPVWVLPVYLLIFAVLKHK